MCKRLAVCVFYHCGLISYLCNFTVSQLFELTYSHTTNNTNAINAFQPSLHHTFSYYHFAYICSCSTLSDT